MSQIEQFASQHNLLLRKDGCRDLLIPAKLGHIYEHSASLLGVLLSESDRYTNRILLDRRRLLLKAGLKAKLDLCKHPDWDPEDDEEVQARFGCHRASATDSRSDTASENLVLATPIRSEKI
jgi:hypothetical protein